MSKEKILTNEDDDDLHEEDIVEKDLKEAELPDSPEKREPEEEREGSLRTEEVEESGSSEEISEEEREERRKERQRKRERRRQAEAAAKARIAELEGTVAAMAKRLSATEHRNHAGDIERLDQAINATKDFVSRANAAMAAAVKAADGEAVAQINEQLFNARQNLSNYEGLKKRLTEETTARVTRQETTGREPVGESRITPQQRKYAKEFASKNSWYDPELKDHDSRVLHSLDESLSDEGWDPSTQEYWDELDILARRYLSHRYTKTKPNGNGARPSGGSPGGTGRTESGGSVDDSRNIPRQLVADWKEAGIWDDPKRRAKALKDYRRIQADIKGTGRAA